MRGTDGHLDSQLARVVIVRMVWSCDLTVVGVIVVGVIVVSGHVTCQC